MTTNLGKDINIIVYNYVHRDLMKSVISEYKNSVAMYCYNSHGWKCNCESGGVCNISILVGSRKVKYNYRDLKKCRNDMIYDIRDVPTKYELPPKYYYSL